MRFFAPLSPFDRLTRRLRRSRHLVVFVVLLFTVLWLLALTFEASTRPPGRSL